MHTFPTQSGADARVAVQTGAKGDKRGRASGCTQIQLRMVRENVSRRRATTYKLLTVSSETNARHQKGESDVGERWNEVHNGKEKKSRTKERAQYY